MSEQHWLAVPSGPQRWVLLAWWLGASWAVEPRSIAILSLAFVLSFYLVDFPSCLLSTSKRSSFLARCLSPPRKECECDACHGSGNASNGSTGRVMTMYHGTSAANVQSIKQNGFRPSSSGMLGPGVYVSRDRQKAEKYGDTVLELDVRHLLKTDSGRSRLVRRSRLKAS